MPNPIKVFIVDDHALVRLGIRRLLEDITGIEVIGEAASGEELLKVVKDKRPNIVLLDVKMPGIGGLETTRRLARSYPEIKIIALSAYQEEPFLSRVLQAGADGYLRKEDNIDELAEAFRKVSAGQRYISSAVAQQLALRSVSETPGTVSPLDNISERELQIMLMITNGLKVKEISKRLHLSPKTVNCYRYRLFRKLGIKNDVALTHLALRYNILDKVNAAELNLEHFED